MINEKIIPFYLYICTFPGIPGILSNTMEGPLYLRNPAPPSRYNQVGIPSAFWLSPETK
jgi:hypothetical protein